MKKLLILIMMCFCTACGSNTANESTEAGGCIKETGPVYIELESIPNGTYFTLAEDYTVTIHYWRTYEYTKPATARLVVSSEQADIPDGEMIFEHFEAEQYSKENDSTTTFTITRDMLKEDWGEISFELQLLNSDGSVADLHRRSFYFSKKEQLVYLSHDIEEVQKSAGITVPAYEINHSTNTSDEVYLSLHSIYDIKEIPITDSYSVTVHYGRNVEYSQPTKAKLVISSYDANISDGEILLEDFETDKYSKENDATTTFTITSDMLLEESGTILFEIQVLDSDGTVSSSCWSSIYFAKTGEHFYISGNSIENVRNAAGID